MSAPLVGVTPIFAVCFWGNDMGKLIAVSTATLLVRHRRLVRLMLTNVVSVVVCATQRKAMSTPDTQQLSMGQLMFAGGFSAIPATVRRTSPLQVNSAHTSGERTDAILFVAW